MMEKESQTRVTINGMEVVAEFINTQREFKWRLTSGDESSCWANHYGGILTFRFKNGRTFGLATDYWNGTLPIEVPFEIIQA